MFIFKSEIDDSHDDVSFEIESENDDHFNPNLYVGSNRATESKFSKQFNGGIDSHYKKLLESAQQNSDFPKMG